MWLSDAHCQVLLVDNVVTDNINDTSIIWGTPLGE